MLDTRRSIDPLSAPFPQSAAGTGGIGAFLATFRMTFDLRSPRLRRSIFCMLRPILVSALLTCLLAWQPVAAQALRSRAPGMSIERLRATVMAADAASLFEDAASTLEVTLDGEGGFYSRGQATLILADWFDAHPPLDFRITRERRTPTAAFIEATLTDRHAGERHAWVIRYAVQNGSWRIRELVVEAEHANE
jgi:hypothetical protein